MSVIYVTKENFEEIKQGDRPVLLDFFAEWCGPCRMIAPIIDEIAEEREDVAVCKVNVDNEPSLAEAFGVFSIPTLVVLKNGEEVARATGARPKDSILDMIDD